MRFMGYMQAGGAIMWIILALSIVALAVAIERVIFFCRAWTNPELLERAFGEAVASGDEYAMSHALRGKSSMHRLFTVAYVNWQLDGEDMKLLLEGLLRREIYRWERNLPLLDVVVRVSPLLGLLGTVLGMVEMFQSLNIGGGMNAQTVTGGIWKALFTTVAGLSVAIPIIILHGLLLGRIDKEEETLQRGAECIMRLHLANTREDGRGA